MFTNPNSMPTSPQAQSTKMFLSTTLTPNGGCSEQSPVRASSNRCEALLSAGLDF